MSVYDLLLKCSSSWIWYRDFTCFHIMHHGIAQSRYPSKTIDPSSHHPVNNGKDRIALRNCSAVTGPCYTEMYDDWRKSMMVLFLWGLNLMQFWLLTMLAVQIAWKKLCFIHFSSIQRCSFSDVFGDEIMLRSKMPWDPSDFKRIREAVHGSFLDALIFELSNAWKCQNFGRHLNPFSHTEALLLMTEKSCTTSLRYTFSFFPSSDPKCKYVIWYRFEVGS